LLSPFLEKLQKGIIPDEVAEELKIIEKLYGGGKQDTGSVWSRVLCPISCC